MYSKSVQSKMKNEQGKMFEKLILAGCDYYKRKGTAIIEKTPEPFSVKRKMQGGQFVGQFHKNQKAQPDFQGTLTGGRSIIFEAKSTLEDKIKQSVVSDAQFNYLKLHEELGACAGVCVQVRKTYAFIPFSIWKDMKELYGRKYMTENEIKKFEVNTFGYIAFLDYVTEERWGC